MSARGPIVEVLVGVEAVVAEASQIKSLRRRWPFGTNSDKTNLIFVSPSVSVKANYILKHFWVLHQYAVGVGTKKPPTTPM
jgi:hypothetical protein